MGAPQVGSGPVNYANAESIVFLIHVKKLLLAVTLQFGFSAPPTLSLQITSSLNQKYFSLSSIDPFDMNGITFRSKPMRQHSETYSSVIGVVLQLQYTE